MIFRLATSIAILIGLCLSANAEEVRHSFLGVGKANRTVIVGEDGKVKWRGWTGRVVRQSAGQRWLGATQWQCPAGSVRHQGVSERWRRRN